MRRFCALLWLSSILALPLEAGELALCYQTDFSQDPQWISSNPDHYFWEPAAGVFHVTQVNIPHGGEYAYYNAGYSGGSFRLEYSIRILRSDYASGLFVGLFEPGLNTHDSGSSYVILNFGTTDRGHTLWFYARDSSDIHRNDDWQEPDYNLGTWYRVAITYDAEARTLTAEVTEEETGTPFAQLSLDNVGPFPATMGLVGSSNVRTPSFQVPGASAEAEIDNIAFFDGTPDAGQERIRLAVERFIQGIEAREGYHNVRGLCYSPDGKRLYAAHWQRGTVISPDPIGVYCSSNLALLYQLVVGDCVFNCTVSDDGRYIYGTAYYGGKVVRFDTENGNAKDEITVGSWAHGVWKSPDGSKLIVIHEAASGSSAQKASLVDITGGNFTLVDTYSFGRHVSGNHSAVSFSPDSRFFYVVVDGSSSEGPALLELSMDGGLSVTRKLILCDRPGALQISGGVLCVGDKLYVVDNPEQCLHVIDRNSFTELRRVGIKPHCTELALHPDGKHLLLGFSGCVVSILALDSWKEVGATMLPRQPSDLDIPVDILVAGDGSKAFVSSYGGPSESQGIFVLRLGRPDGPQVPAVAALSEDVVSCVEIETGQTRWSVNAPDALDIVSISDGNDGWNVLVSSPDKLQAVEGRTGTVLWELPGRKGNPWDVYVDVGKVFYGNPDGVSNGMPNLGGSSAPDIVYIPAADPRTVQVIDTATAEVIVTVKGIPFDVRHVLWLPRSLSGDPADYDIVLIGMGGEGARISIPPAGGTVDWSNGMLWSVSGLGNRSGVGVRDVNGDGVGDLALPRIVWNDRMLVLSGSDGSTIWEAGYGSFDLTTGTPFVITASDGTLQMVVSAQGSGSQGAIRRYLVSDGTTICTVPGTYNNNTLFGIIQSTDRKIILSGWRHTGKAVAFDWDTCEVLWDNIPCAHSDFSLVAITDLSGDGMPEILSVDPADGLAKCYDPITGNPVAGVPTIAADTDKLSLAFLRNVAPSTKNLLAAGVVEGGSCLAEVPIEVTASLPIAGFSFGLVHDPTKVCVQDAEPGAAWEQSGIDPAIWIAGQASGPNGEEGITVAAVVSTAQPVQTVPAGETLEIARITYRARHAGASALEFSGNLGDPPVAVLLSLVQGGRPQPVAPQTQGGSVGFTGVCFVRGEVDGDGNPTLNDAITVLYYLFADLPLLCLDAADVNDDGAIDISDPIYEIDYLFRAGPEPTAPFPQCGPDSTEDELNCGAFELCSECK